MNTLVCRMDMHQEKMESTIHSLRAWWKEMMEAHLECKEPTSEDMKSKAEHQEVLKEHAAGETGRVPNKQHRNRHLADKRHQE
jgi:hypothetical protein